MEFPPWLNPKLVTPFVKPLIDELKGISNEWFRRHNIGEHFANGIASFGFNHKD